MNPGGHHLHSPAEASRGTGLQSPGSRSQLSPSCCVALSSPSTTLSLPPPHHYNRAAVFSRGRGQDYVTHERSASSRPWRPADRLESSRRALWCLLATRIRQKGGFLQ